MLRHQEVLSGIVKGLLFSLAQVKAQVFTSDSAFHVERLFHMADDSSVVVAAGSVHHESKDEKDPKVHHLQHARGAVLCVLVTGRSSFVSESDDFSNL